VGEVTTCRWGCQAVGGWCISREQVHNIAWGGWCQVERSYKKGWAAGLAPLQAPFIGAIGGTL